FHKLKYTCNRRLLEIGQVHGNLSEPADLKSSSLHIAQAAGRETDRLGDLFRHVDIRGVQENVIGNECFAGAHHRCASRWMAARIPEVRFAGWIDNDIVAKAFKLPATNVF